MNIKSKLSQNKTRKKLKINKGENHLKYIIKFLNSLKFLLEFFDKNQS